MINDFYNDLEKRISEKLLIAKYIITQVSKWWKVLRFQERFVIFYRFIDLELDEGNFKEFGETRKQISQRLNVSEREVRTIENKAISKILNLN
jgi:DNA-directed RNA polymerase sigma subunit (sigma70/sigma32)